MILNTYKGPLRQKNWVVFFHVQKVFKNRLTKKIQRPIQILYPKFLHAKIILQPPLLCYRLAWKFYPDVTSCTQHENKCDLMKSKKALFLKLSKLICLGSLCLLHEDSSSLEHPPNEPDRGYGLQKRQ